MTIIFFSGNLHKAREIEAIFAPFRVRIYTDFMKPFEVVECGKSFSENAKIKLNALKNAIESQGFDNIFNGEVEQKDCILMAEDSGICVESLDNFPNIFSARFANLPKDLSAFCHCEAKSLHAPSLRGVANAEAIHELDCHDSTRCVESRNDNIKDSTDSENIARLISELKAKGLSESKAQFVSCVACCKLGNSKDASLRGESKAIHSPTFRHCEALSNAEAIQKNNVDCHDSANAESRNDEIKSQKDKYTITTHGFLNGKVITQTRGANGFGYDPIFVPNGFESTLAEMPSEVKNALSHRKIALDLMRLILCPLSAKNLS